MTKQEILNDVNKLGENDTLSRNLVIEIIEQLDEPKKCKINIQSMNSPSCSLCGASFIVGVKQNYCYECGALIEREEVIKQELNLFADKKPNSCKECPLSEHDSMSNTMKIYCLHWRYEHCPLNEPKESPKVKEQSDGK